MAQGRIASSEAQRAPARTRRDIVGWALLAATVALVVWELHPAALLANTTPVSGDLGAHLHEPWFLRHHLLGHGRISGWSQDAYSGYPIGTFYFPLGMLLSALLSFVLPFTIAFKLVSASGAVALPIAAFAFGRLTGRDRLSSSCFAVATLPLLLEPQVFFSGGSIGATAYGEYSYEIGLALGLVALGVVWRGLDTGRYRALSAVLVGLSVLAHLVTGSFVVLGVGVLFLVRPCRARLQWLLTTVGPALALTGFWIVPFVVRGKYTSGSGFAKGTPVASYLLSQTFLPNYVLAVAGAVLAIRAWRRDRSGAAVVALAVAAALAVATVPSGRVWNVRFLGIWLLMLCLLAGWTLIELGRGIDRIRVEEARGRAIPNPDLAAMVVPAIMLLLVPVLWMTPVAKGILASHQTYLIDKDQADTSTYIDHQYGGYQRSPLKGDYRRLLNAFHSVTAEHGCGRVQWEWNKGKGEDEEVFMLLMPYWTNGCLTSTYGLFVESSPTMPFTVVANSRAATDPYHLQRSLPYGHFDFDRGLAQMRILGVRYYFATSDEAHSAADASNQLVPIATVDSTTHHPWWMYELRNTAVVEGLSSLPIVSRELGSRSSWQSAGLRWFGDATPDSSVFVAEGPASWPRARRVDAAVTGRPVPSAGVSRVRVSDDRVSFHVDHTGTPVLVRVSYFPNWRASGAKGPWRSTPNYMVVVPTSHDVTLHYARSSVELLGLLVTLAGIVGVALLRNRPLTVPGPAEVVEDAVAPQRRPAKTNARRKKPRRK